MTSSKGFGQPLNSVTRLSTTKPKTQPLTQKGAKISKALKFRNATIKGLKNLEAQGYGKISVGGSGSAKVAGAPRVK